MARTPLEPMLIPGYRSDRNYVLWFFERAGERLQCEIRPSTHAAGFELEWTTQDGHVNVERSETPDQLAQRWFELEQGWKRDGWKKLDEVAHSRPKR